jgi:flagellin
MPQVINTNVMSLNAQRNLTKSGNEMATAIQRLSSGLRINSAKDDAAGLAITDRMTTQISGLNQAVRNANDGISLSQTTEGALQEVTNNLQRIRELAVQAANATNSASDRVALDQEVQQRLQEINRIASQTSFNGRKVLDGTFGNATFQVGANVGETIAIGLDTSMKTSAIGQIATAASGDLDTMFNNGSGLTLAANQLTVNGSPVAPANYPDATSLITAINAAYAASGGTGNVATANGNEITVTNTTGTPITFGGSAATTLGLATVPAQTTGGPATGGRYQSGVISDLTHATVAATSGTYTSAAITLSDYSGTPSVFTVDGAGNTVTLNQNYTTGGATLQDVADDIQTQLDATAAGTYSVSVSGSGIEIAKVATGSASTAPVIADVSGGTIWSSGASAAGQDANTTANTAFTVDSHNITLDQDYANLTAMAADVQTKLNAAAGSAAYTVTSASGGLLITKTATGASSLAPSVVGSFLTTGGSGTGGTDLGATTPGVINSTGVNAAVSATGTPSPQTFALGEFTIQIGTNPPMDMEGTFATSQELAEAINSRVGGVYASIDANGVLQVNAGEVVTIGGTRAGAGATNLGFATLVNDVSGNLNTTNVLSFDGANDTILRIDSALTSVSTLRSTLGAIQNRFQSTINSLSAVAENLSASRSRILDTDFAAETAAMTRAQILQQAGTAMVAQANAVPQNVLSLLK